MVEFINEMLQGFGAEATVLIMSMIPVVELRGAIPMGIALGLTPLNSSILSFLGSMVPVPFILFGIPLCQDSCRRFLSKV